jgi:AcrR family transcriptional regulator
MAPSGLSTFMTHYCLSMPRKYELKRRAASLQDTRRRITQATMELHQTVGPARTTISAIAERAGVQRLTVYRHFPDERSLFAACSAHWRAGDPPPDPRAWAAIEDPDERCRAALIEVYGWYRRQEAMLANVRRDAPGLPALAEVADPTPFIEASREVLMAGRRERKRARAALGHALEFSTWRSLARGQGLSDAKAAGMMTRLARG